MEAIIWSSYRQWYGGIADQYIRINVIFEKKVVYKKVILSCSESSEIRYWIFETKESLLMLM